MRKKLYKEKKTKLGGIVREKALKKALDSAYKSAGHNAYFENGFRAGVRCAEEEPNGNQWLKLTLKRSIRSNRYLLDRNKQIKNERAQALEKNEQLKKEIVVSKKTHSNLILLIESKDYEIARLKSELKATKRGINVE